MRRLYTVTYLLHNEQQLVAKDTQATEEAEGTNYGEASFRQFKEKDTVKIVTEDGTEYFVPFHAIIWAKVETQTVEETTKDNEFCNYEGC